MIVRWSAVLAVVIMATLGTGCASDVVDGGDGGHPAWMVGDWNPSDKPAPDDMPYRLRADGTCERYTSYAMTAVHSTGTWSQTGSGMQFLGMPWIFQAVNSNSFTISSDYYGPEYTNQFFRVGYEPGKRSGTTNTYTVFYYNRKGWTSVNLHYYNGTMWTAVPGPAMSVYTNNWFVISNVQAIGNLEFVPGNAGLHWDNPGGIGGVNYVASNALAFVYDDVVYSAMPTVPVMDAYESDDTFAAAGPITFGAAGKQQRSIHVPDDNDYIRVVLTNGVGYEFRTEAPSGGTPLEGIYLSLYDGSETGLFSTSNSSGTTTSLWFLCRSTGMYYLRVRGWSWSWTGRYALSAVTFGPLAADGYEADDSYVTAKPVLMGPANAQQRTIMPGADVDYASVVLTNTCTYQFRIDPPASNVRFEGVSFALYDSGLFLWRSSTGNSGVTSVLNYTCTATGTYYLRVSGDDSSDIGGYTLSVLATSVNDTYEPDGTSGEAKPISIGAAGAQSRKILVPSDVDWVSFPMTAGLWYTIKTYSAGAGSDVDTYISLYSPSLSFLFNNDQNGVDDFSTLNWYCTSSGWYYLSVEGQYGSTGEYMLSVTQP